MTISKLRAFPSAHRILQRREFTVIGCHGRKYDTRYMRAFVVTSSDRTAHARIGITVTKRVGNAVVRNRIRRHVREAFRTIQWPAGTDIVVVATTAAATATGNAIKQSIQTISERLAKSPPSPKVGP